MTIILLNISLSSLLHKNIKPYLKGIIFFPIWILTWLPINCIYIFKKYGDWVEIKHNRSISLEEISAK